MDGVWELNPINGRLLTCAAKEVVPTLPTLTH